MEKEYHLSAVHYSTDEGIKEAIDTVNEYNLSKDELALFLGNLIVDNDIKEMSKIVTKDGKSILKMALKNTDIAEIKWSVFVKRKRLPKK